MTVGRLLCYNQNTMKCEVVVNGADGRKSTSAGEIEIYNDGFDLDYFISDDRCRTSVRNGVMTYSRRGNTDIDLTLARGRNTVCVLLSGELTGNVPVRTVYLDWSCDGVSAAVKAEYYLGGARITVDIAARIL